MVQIKQKGDFSKTDNFLKNSIKVTEVRNIYPVIEQCIRRLIEATPKDSGITSTSWTYEIESKKNAKIVRIKNTNLENGTNVALLLDIGHATSGGTWVEGKNYIEPVVRETYNQILSDTWKELTRL